jgi:hypothetical protein
LRHGDVASLLPHLESVTLGFVTELRLNGKTPDGAYLNLTDSEGGEYTLRISDTLRATVNQPRLAAVRDNESGSMTVKEIQARLRAGDSIDSLAREAQWTTDKVERFAGPILQERTYIIGLAHTVTVRIGGNASSFFDTVTAKLTPRQVDMTAVDWNAWRQDDGNWVIRLNYPIREGLGSAEWNFDQARRTISALDESARWILGDETSPRERSTSDHGLIYGNHPSVSRVSQSRSAEGGEGPRLVSIRETPDSDSEKDGVTARAKVPSWDEIMFGTPKKNDAETE